VLDAFAGTGSLGLEALSRGADDCTFIEKDRHIRLLLQRNLEDLGLTEQAQVLAMDALSPAWVAVLKHRPLRVVFLDPPYAMTEGPQHMPRVTALMEALAATPGVIEPGGALVLRMASPVLAPVVLGWTVAQTFEYGSMALHFYQPNPGV
jgi:16S rRNA (guanine966-N2)-methyltransferase